MTSPPLSSAQILEIVIFLRAEIHDWENFFTKYTEDTSLFVHLIAQE